jgi:hypothetical protein
MVVGKPYGLGDSTIASAAEPTRSRETSLRAALPEFVIGEF